MNPPAKHNEAYQPTTIEHIANIITHGVDFYYDKSLITVLLIIFLDLKKSCVLPAAYATFVLVNRATNPTQFWAAWIYGLALIFLFGISAAFHSTCLCQKSRYISNF